jgi:hypothetical protein
LKALDSYRRSDGAYCYRGETGCGLPRVESQIMYGLSKVSYLRVNTSGRWQKLVSSAAFPDRDSARTFVFQNRYWLSNGYVELGNDLRDLWSSGDGLNWQLETSPTPYDPYSAMAVFNGRIWAANWSVWSSDDGKVWRREMENAPFSDRTRNAQARLLSHQNKLFFLGFDGVWASSDGVDWQLLSRPEFLPRGGYSAVSWQDRMWVLGGYSPVPSDPPEKGYPSRTSRCDVWSSADGIDWRLETEIGPTPCRAWPAAVTLENGLYLVGGFDGLSDMNIADAWHTVDGRNWNRVGAGSIFSARHAASMIAVDNCALLLAGNSWPVQNDIWSYCP